MITGSSEQAGSAERERAAQDYRRAVRTTGMGLVFGTAGVFAVDAFLPSTTAADRQGLLVTAALVAATGIIWFWFVPQRWFGEARAFVAAAVAELVLLAMVYQTGGVQSTRIGYLVVPTVALILSGSVRQILVIGGLVFSGIGVLAIWSSLAGDPPGDGAISRLLLLAMVIALCAAVARTTGRHRMVTTERAADLADESAAVLSMTMTDVLTNLPNRRALPVRLIRFVADARRTGLPFSAIAIDIDGLKQVNDILGHDAGDVLLRNFGLAIHDVVRGSDVGLRIGGDEFLILLPRTTSAQAERVADHLRETAGMLPPRPARFTYGIATLQPGDSGDDVIARADATMNALKREHSAAARSPESGVS